MGASNMLVEPLGSYVGATMSCHTWWSLAWSLLGCNCIGNVVVGMYNMVYMVKLIVYIYYGNRKLHSLLYIT